jgi:hypothetical protein
VRVDNLLLKREIVNTISGYDTLDLGNLRAGSLGSSWRRGATATIAGRREQEAKILLESAVTH